MYFMVYFYTVLNIFSILVVKISRFLTCFRPGGEILHNMQFMQVFAYKLHIILFAPPSPCPAVPLPGLFPLFAFNRKKQAQKPGNR